MAIALTANVLPAQLWPQGDERDPLGVWGFRLGVTGDASSGGIKVTGVVPAGLQAAYIYTCYSVNMAILTQASATDVTGKCRLLTNWPDVDTSAGLTGYSTARAFQMKAATKFSGQAVVIDQTPILTNERFILLFDPRSRNQTLNIVELEIGDNILDDTYIFEGYGYFWDRSVMQAPGGPRHPGAS